jgi:hypothetical protein
MGMSVDMGLGSGFGSMNGDSGMPSFNNNNSGMMGMTTGFDNGMGLGSGSDSWMWKA